MQAVRKLYRHLISVGFIFVFALIGYAAQAQLFRAIEEERQFTVPFQMRGNLITVDLIMDRLIPMKFIFDTGAENTLLFNRKYSDYLGCQYERKIPVYGSNLDSAVNALITRNVELQLIGLPVLETDILVLESAPEGIQNSLGMEIYGILGAHFFGSVPFEINYRRGQITFYHPEDWSSLSKEKYDVIPLQMKDRKPYCSIGISSEHMGEEELLFLLDTGASLGILIHQNTSDELELPPQAAEGILGYGISGYLTGFLSRLKRLEMGPHVFEEIIVSFQNLDRRKIDSTDITRNGIIGNSMLKKFNLVFDYTSSRLYLKTNRNFSKKQKFDKSGAVIGAFGPHLDEYTVIRVLDGSPADKAGLRRGDIIRWIGWLPASAYQLQGITNKFKGRDQKKICLRILRGDEKIKTRITLESLL